MWWRAVAVAGGAGVLAALAVLWWERRYDEPPQNPDLTGRVVAVDPPAQPGYFGRGAWHLRVEPDPGAPPGRPVWVTVRRETPVRGPDGRAGTFAVGQRVRVWHWGVTELADGHPACQAMFVAVGPAP